MNLSQLTAPANLYRILSFDRAAEIITSRQLYFAHPSTWDDPYERVLKHDAAKAIFAQCWCRKAVSDAMWRIYSPHGLGVRIATTRQRLQQCLAAARRTRPFSYATLNVEYLNQEEIESRLEEARSQLRAEFSVEAAIEPLFLKRRAFDHEREARVVIFDEHSLKGDPKNGISIDIDPFKLLTSIWIDPRAPEETVKAYKFYLKEKLGFPGTVEKSRLYAVPDSLSSRMEACGQPDAAP
ncbi:DUF2971 domain-containing protein [Limnohabitans planktonicus]|uniref:DUF2971 domain-containing protein n=1 Tax=Limnohabitans planktonicus II-D5 TaxID=1293045 RepID=A0A2T7UJB4_9BURK|nr:DUF2971 domain-containing protein [Limnohabitans planktonicus]PVE44741.1 hypothetical protein H663_001655 [Limnohabitans planktonicus II-D5]|eukprot:gene24275-30595_t